MTPTVTDIFGATASVLLAATLAQATTRAVDTWGSPVTDTYCISGALLGAYVYFVFSLQTRVTVWQLVLVYPVAVVCGVLVSWLFSLVLIAKFQVPPSAISFGLAFLAAILVPNLLRNIVLRLQSVDILAGVLRRLGFAVADTKDEVATRNSDVNVTVNVDSNHANPADQTARTSGTDHDKR
jgi:branched-subunit amino acid ABC-type transport system permease component